MSADRELRKHVLDDVLARRLGVRALLLLRCGVRRHRDQHLVVQLRVPDFERAHVRELAEGHPV